MLKEIEVIENINNQEEVLRIYNSKLLTGNILPSVESIRMLGSVGRDNMSPTSDMDVWLILKPGIEFKDVVQISDSELSIRDKLSKETQMPNLGRHRASIFFPEEAYLYEQVFSVRVGTPRLLGEQKVVFGPEDKNDFIGRNNSDVVVSLGEFITNFQRYSGKTSHKWLRRIIQELEYYKNGERITSNAVLDEKIFSQSPEFIVTKANDFINFLNVPQEKIEKRQLAHKLMWTLEKVRWELIDSYNNPNRFESWRHGKEKFMGFNPDEISKLVIETVGLLDYATDSTKDLGKELISITRDQYDQGKLEHFHNVLRSWLIENAKFSISETPNDKGSRSFVLPTKVNGKRTTSRIGIGSSERFVLSEYMAYSHVEPEVIINYIPGRLDIVDRNGIIPTIKDIDSNIRQ